MEGTQVQSNPSRVIQFTLNYVNKAIRKTSVSSRQERESMQKQDLNPTPDVIGKWAGRINLQTQISKTPQERFLDLFA